MNKPNLLDAIAIASPLFFESSDSREIKSAIKEIKTITGIGPLAEPLGLYNSWVIKCDELFTRRRCRTDHQVKRFLSLNKELEKFLSKKIDLSVLILHVQQQIEILKVLASRPTKIRKPKKEDTNGEKKDKKELPENSRAEFVMRKLFQAVIISIPLAILSWVITANLLISATVLAYSLLGFLLGVILLMVFYLSPKETLSQKIAGYFLASGYVIVFLFVAEFSLESVRAVLGLWTEVVLIILLIMTEVIARWGPLDLLHRSIVYIESAVYIALFLIAAAVVGSLIGESIWVAISVLAAIYGIWSRKSSQKEVLK